ncbi:MAG TPA: cytochrome c peroxidase [Acetobacteraceae bacterium]|nr:cytochrome c peroxidase [Acetobacteraceae bacterium]
MRRAAVRLAAGLLLAAVASGAGLAVGGQGPVPGPAAGSDATARLMLAHGENPWPVHLRRPPAGPLSAMAELGQDIFFDASLSRSGKLSCAACHQPAHAYGPPGDAPAMMGGPAMARQGVRAVPSLMYLERHPAFSVGPDNEENETVTLAQMVALTRGAARAQKNANDTAQSAAALVPQGGLFWDGRADSLQQQALGPMLDPREMDGGSVDELAGKLRRAAYAPLFVQLFGPAILNNRGLLVAEAQFAVGRYQIEDPAFHPYSSKFDAWLEGRARLNPAQLRGYVLFNDADKADCAGCHVDRVSADGTPPLFTDFQFEALGAPRNTALRANANPAYFDLGVCGPYRRDMRAQTQYCGMFLTPTLRNVARRHVFFHNGVFRTLQQVMDFYAFRDVAPERVYPRATDGKVAKYNDLPAADRGNVDVTDPPFGRPLGGKPAMTEPEERDIIAFLGTLTDGWRPAARAPR